MKPQLDGDRKSKGGLEPCRQAEGRHSVGEPGWFGTIPCPGMGIGVEVSSNANGQLSWETPEFGSAGSSPGPALLSHGLPPCRNNWRESFSWTGFFLTCFLLESRMSLNISGSRGRSDPHHWCQLWWRGGKPKVRTFPCKDTVEQIRIQLQLASCSFIPCPSLRSAYRRLDCHPGGSALPGMLPLHS